MKNKDVPFENPMLMDNPMLEESLLDDPLIDYLLTKEEKEGLEINLDVSYLPEPM